MATVLFRGRDQVLDAYRFNSVGPWAIWCGKEMPFSCDEDDIEVGAGLLEDCLNKLVEGYSEATFVLKVYKRVPPTGIASNTPWSNSFPFKLYSDQEYENRNPFTNTQKAIMGRLEQIEQRLAGDDDEGEVEDSSMMGRIGAMLNRPDVQNFILQKVFGFVNRIFPDQKTGPASMTGFNMEQTKTAPELFAELPGDERQKFDMAISILLERDKQIGTNLLKLAMICQNDPGKYDMLCRMA